MRDSLDLDALQRQSEQMLRLRAFLRRSQLWLTFSFVVVLIGLILASHSPATRPWFENATQFVVIGLALTIHTYLVYFVLVAVIGVKGIYRAERYKPDFVPSVSWNYLIIKLLILIYSIGCLIALHYVIYTRSYLFIPVMLLLLLPEIWDSLYRRFFGWVIENLPESLERVKFLLPYHYPLFNLHLVVQSYKGAYLELEEAQRTMLSGRYSLHWAYLSAELNNYACTLLDLGRYEEAMRLLESAIRINPIGIPFYNTLAAFYFRQNIELERAMQCVEYVFDHHGNDWPNSYGTALAQRAYIAALLNDPEQAEASSAMAQNYVDKRMQAKPQRSIVAEIYYRLGETARILNDPIRARILYAYAIEAASDTIHAQRAREQMGKLSP
ncbi:MAG: tetratricopeptide repeat protein [Anaerolineae bacterium]|jgi:tetratricopeptide (TPR) repeat protein|nr:tetratricopeptide repeat protein [Anaerolineae bacterium]